MVLCKLEASSSSDPPPIPSIFVKPPIEVNSSLYEVHRPKEKPAMQIYFFHGLQFGDASEGDFWSTWRSKDGSCIWPQTWLVEDFPNAQIFFVSYQAAVRNRSNSIMDLYLITENLMHDFLNQPGIGQGSGCPVILVGHCLGGIVIKNLCLTMKDWSSKEKPGRKKVRIQAFLDNIKGIFYYDTPHLGIPKIHKLPGVKKSPLLSYFQSLTNETARLNYEFQKVRELYGNWRIHALGASLPTKVSPYVPVILIIPEASAREGDGFNMVESVDHFTISNPESKKKRSFSALKNLLTEIAIDHETVGQQCHGLPPYCPGLKERAHKVQDLRTRAMVVGIVGMGGIGKTTIAMQVFNDISKEFEYTCFVENVKGIQCHELEKWMCGQFHRNGVMIGGSGISWNGLKGKKTLLVMDDVDSETQLKNCRNLDHFGNGSCLIFTTRNRGVLGIYPAPAVYDVELLTDNEAKRLFCQYAFSKEGLPNNTKYAHLEKDVVRVVHKCQGLPLTLELMGCYLRGHEGEVEFWNETVENLGRAQAIDGSKNDRLFASLRVSVDALSEVERKMFIEAGTYFFEQLSERAFAAWSTAHKSSNTAWQNLLSKSLVKEHEVEGLHHGLKLKRIWMHEHLRDLAKMLDQCHVVFCKGREAVHKAMDLLNANAMEKETSILDLSKSFEESFEESDEESDEKPDLELTLASRGQSWLKSSCSRNDDHKRVKLCSDDHKRRQLLKLSSLEKLEGLKYIRLAEVPHEGTGVNFPKKISLLSWSRCQSRSTRWRRELPFSLEGMNNLAVLELRYWEVPKSFSPSLGSLVKLRILSLCNLDGLDRLPEDFGNLSCLKELHLSRLDLTTLPRSFGNLSALQVLSIDGCGNMDGLPEDFGNLSALQVLSIWSCGNIEVLPESFGKLSSLVTLDIFWCEKLARLPESFGALSSLVTLHITYSNLESLPLSFFRLSSLKTLSIESTMLVGLGDALWSLPDRVVCLSALTDLSLECPNLESLPESFGLLSSLEKLHLEAGSKLRRLPGNIGQLKALKQVTVDLDHPEAMNDFLLSLSLLPSLQELEIHCPRLTDLPDAVGELTSLKSLDISCTVLETLPCSFGRLSALSSVAVTSRMSRSLPEEIGNLTSLKRLVLQDCFELVTLPSSVGRIHSLREVQLVRCKSLRTLPNSLRRVLSPQVGSSHGNDGEKHGQSSRTAATEEIKLEIYGCGNLSDTVLERLGWESRGSYMFDGKYWYPRNESSKGTAAILSTEVNPQ